MADPSKFTPGFDYSGYEANNPTDPKPGDELDIDFANVEKSIGELVDAVKDVRRSDGALKNAIVTPSSLNEETITYLGLILKEVEVLAPRSFAFAGDGVETDFTLEEAPGAQAAVNVYLSGVWQSPDSYTISGTTLSFDTAPPAPGVGETTNIEGTIADSVPFGTAAADAVSYAAPAPSSAVTVREALDDLFSFMFEVFETRAAAEASSIAAGTKYIAVYHGGVRCDYARDSAGTALTTADGQKWSPLGGKATPAHWGGEPGYDKDASAAIQACIDWARTKYSTVSGGLSAGSFTASVNLLDMVWRNTTGNVNATNIRQPNFLFGNGTIFIDATSGMGLQFYGTNSLTILGTLRVEGPINPVNCPDVLFGVGRCAFGGAAAPIASSAEGRVFVDGCAKKAQVVNLGCEVSHLELRCNGNSVEGDNVFSLFHSGNMQDAVDVFGSALTSTVCTLPTPADGPFSNILHQYGRVELKRAAYWNGKITNIALGSTTTVSFSVANFTQAGRMANGQKIWIPYNEAGGVTELQQRVFTIANLAFDAGGLTGTFDLQGENSTGYTAYTSGGSIWAKTGPFACLGTGVGYYFAAGSYGLAYGETGILLHCHNGVPRDVRWDGQMENQIKFPVSIDAGSAGGTKIIQRMRLDLMSAAQVHAAPLRKLGSETLSINHLELNVTSHATTYPLFDDGTGVNIQVANIRSPTEVDVSGLNSFTGWVHLQAPAASRWYTSKNTYIEAGSALFTMPDAVEFGNLLRHAGDTDTHLSFPAADTVRITAGGVSVGTATTTGFGVGNTAPAFDLDISGVSGSGDASLRIKALGTGATDDAFLRMQISGNTGRNFIDFGDSDVGNIGIIGYHHSDDSLRFTVNSAEAMRIDSAGQLGLGVTAPDYLMHIGGIIGWAPGASATPANNGDVVVEATNNTTLTFKLKGSDGTVRSATLTLS